ncbi:MAG: hypothetical protein IJ719_07440 [Clostridia bacterium]|nr:hypothetical protein [Clostridia bacterium]
MKSYDQRNRLPARQTSSGVYALCQPGIHKEAALKFLLEKLGNQIENMRDMEDFCAHPHGVARLLLSREHWNQYCWIEQYGTLEGYSEQALDCTAPRKARG